MRENFVPRLVLILALFFLASTAAVLAAGLTPVTPLGPIAFLAALQLPLAVTIVSIAGVIRSRLPLLSSKSIALLGIGASTVLITLLRHYFLWGLLAIPALFVIRRQGYLKRKSISQLALGLVALAIGYSAVWNCNILLAAKVSTRLMDPLLGRFDSWLYSAFFAGGGAYKEVFPIVTRWPWLSVLEMGYTAVFPELAVIVVILSLWRPRGLPAFLGGLFCAYGIGLFIFLIFPTVGPCIYFPKSISANLWKTETGQIMTLMADGFWGLANNGQQPRIPYFVALPSLHVVIAVYLQRFTIVFPPMFWLFLPINLVIIVGTVLLGYHYILDAIAAMPVAILSIVIADRLGTTTKGCTAPGSLDRT